MAADSSIDCSFWTGTLMPLLLPVSRVIRNLLTFLLVVIVTPAVAQTSGSAVSSPKNTILIVGDSLSAEYGLPRGTGWVALLQQRLQEADANYDVINASVSGDTTSG